MSKRISTRSKESTCKPPHSRLHSCALRTQSNARACTQSGKTASNAFLLCWPLLPLIPPSPPSACTVTRGAAASVVSMRSTRVLRCTATVGTSSSLPQICTVWKRPSVCVCVCLLVCVSVHTHTHTHSTSLSLSLSLCCSLCILFSFLACATQADAAPPCFPPGWPRGVPTRLQVTLHQQMHSSQATAHHERESACQHKGKQRSAKEERRVVGQVHACADKRVHATTNKTASHSTWP